MWCPECGTEYREGFFVCADCECPLVEEKEEESEPEAHVFSPEEWCFLMTVRDEIEANTVEALLKEEEIPVLKKYPGAGEYFKEYLGMTTTGVMLFVPESRVSYAKYLISEGLSFGRQLRRLQLIPESSVEDTAQGSPVEYTKPESAVDEPAGNCEHVVVDRKKNSSAKQFLSLWLIMILIGTVIKPTIDLITMIIMEFFDWWTN